MNRLGPIARLAAAALLPSLAQAALCPADMTNSHQSMTVLEGIGPSQMSYNFAYSNMVAAPFATTSMGGDTHDVPQNLMIGGGTHLLPVGNDDDGTVRLPFLSAFREDVCGTTSDGSGTNTVRDRPPVPVPEAATLFLLGSGLLASGAAVRIRSRTNRRRA